MKHRDPHRRHQQLNQELTLILARLRDLEKQKRRGKGKTPPKEWEKLIRTIRQFSTRRDELHNALKKLKGM